MSNLERPSMDAPPRRGWFRRNWRWLVPAVVLVPVAVAAGYIVAVVAQRKSSEPYTAALKRVQQDPEVIERLGQPIKDPSWIPAGSIHTDHERGQANLIFPVSGPKGSASVRTQARRIAGQWGTTVLEVTFPDGKRVSLGASSDGSGDAPEFKPPAGGQSPKGSGESPAPKPPASANPEIRLDLPDAGPPEKAR